MWKNQRTTQIEERTQKMDVANTGSRRTVLLEVEPDPTHPIAGPQVTRVPRHDIFARLLGLFLCLAGVAIIAGVIYLAYAMYQDPNLARLPSGAAGQAGPSAVDVGSILVRLVFRVIMLAVMSIGGSLIANKGIHMFLASFSATSR